MSDLVMRSHHENVTWAIAFLEWIGIRDRGFCNDYLQSYAIAIEEVV